MYEVIEINGASDPPHSREPSLQSVVDEIEQVYAMAARRGGEVIAGHSLVLCDASTSTGSDGEQAPTRTNYLFLVMELPDEPDQE
jgi:hypothetical protein